MRRIHFFKVICFSLCLVNCNEATLNPIEHALASNQQAIKTVVSNSEPYELQIMLSEIIPSDTDSVSFSDYQFQVDDSKYFYPASTVKFPIAILALEKLKSFSEIDRNTAMLVDGDSIRTTISEAVTQIFAVSDNEAFNRLFEFLGKDYIQQKLDEKGIKARISHRLSVENSTDLKAKPVHFYQGDSIIFSTVETLNDSIEDLDLNQLQKGKSYTIGDSLVNGPMDFSKKNYLPVSSLHGMMKRLMYPNHFKQHERFDLLEADRKFLIETMAKVPRESGYDPEQYYDTYVKFLVVGDIKEAFSEDYKIYNKVGFAYGYLTDCAFIEDKKHKRSYIITATLHVNKNQIYNDGIYEYETVGIPFLAALGREMLSLKN